MSNLLVVFGATGNQGLSVATAALTDPALASQYKVRAVTRDPSKPTAQALQSQGAEVVRGDFDNEASLHAALQDAHTVFLMTNTTVFDEQGAGLEIRHGKTVADAAVAAGARRLIYSTAYPAAELSGGKFGVPHFDAKVAVERYIRGLPVKSVFVAPGSFMQNFMTMTVPRPAGDGGGSDDLVVTGIQAPETELPWIDVEADTGKFVARILAEPERFEGAVFAAANQVCSYEETMRVMSKVTGRSVRYVQIPEETFCGFFPPAAAEAFVSMFRYYEEFGYYGPGMKGDVEWARENARGTLTTLEEYFGTKLKLAG
ncbi:NmrA-like family [Aspergillus sp. HF37]|nr:NmrA-like family [Aspergillus sp. HF37]